MVYSESTVFLHLHFTINFFSYKISCLVTLGNGAGCQIMMQLIQVI